MLADVAKYCFMGEPSLPPKHARSILVDLVQPEHALINLPIRGKNVIHLH
jgi:hypothetical protein